MRKLGVRSCDESDRERNKKLDRVSLFAQKYGKPKRRMGHSMTFANHAILPCTGGNVEVVNEHVQQQNHSVAVHVG